MAGILDGTNQLFNAGMGILSANQRSPVYRNPVDSMQKGLMQGQLLKRQQQQDMMKQQEFEQAKRMKELQMQEIQAKMSAVPERKILKGNDGFNYYEDTHERVLPGVVKPNNPNQPFNADGTPNTDYQDYEINKSTAGKTDVNVNLPKNFPYEIPKGFMPVDVNDPNKGVKPIKGGDKDRMSPTEAAQVTGIQTAQEVLPLIDKLLFNEDGTTNTKNLAMAAMNIPQSEGKELNSYYEIGIQSITRSETGAAMPDSELDNTRARFQPSILDNERSRKVKYSMYKDFLAGTLKLIRPDGGIDNKPALDNEAFDVEYYKRMNANGGDTQIPSVSNDADYNALPPGSVYTAPDGSKRTKK